MKLFLTIDLEDWYCAHDYNIPMQSWDGLESRVEEDVHKLLELLDRYQVRAIFFVLGYIAQRHPELVKEISAKGHIIASHSYSHTKLYEMDKEQFRSDLKRSLELLERLTGKKVKYFRSPSWTFDHRSEYLPEVLSEEGMLVDSSLQPFRTPLSGVKNGKTYPHYLTVHGGSGRILEFPVPVFQIGPLKIPFCGGLYFRALPFWLLVFCFKKTLKRRDCFLYIHPWEIDYGQPKLKVPLYIRFTHTYGIKGNERKLEKFFMKFKFNDPEEFGAGYEYLEHEKT